MKRAAALAVIVTAGMFGSQARAAAPLTVGTGNHPRVAVDANGTAHIAWTGAGLAYCRLPRVAQACAGTKRFTFGDGHDITGPRVLAHGERVLLLDTRCCYPGLMIGSSATHLYLLESTDGGKTFVRTIQGDPPKIPNETKEAWQIGANGISGDAALGPGPKSVTTVDNRSFGVRLAVSPTTGFDLLKCYPRTPPLPAQIACLESVANLGAPAPGLPGFAPEAWFSGSVAFVDPLTPLLALTSGRKPTVPPTKEQSEILVRRFNGGTNYHDPGKWSDFIDVGPGDDSQLAGLPDGKKGIHLLYRIRKSQATWQYVTRRWNDKDRRFGPITPVTEVGFPVFADFEQDAGGRLHAAWLDTAQGLHYRGSKPDGTWNPAVTLQTRAQSPGGIADIDVAAAPDGGGVAVWKARDGKIHAIRFGPAGPIGGGGGDEGPGDCVEQVTVGVAVVLARDGCLKRVGDRYTAPGDLRVNGVDLDASGTTVIDKGDRTLLSSGTVTARVGNIVLGNKKLSWKLPAAKGQIADLAGNPATFDTGGFGTSFLGFDVAGYTTITLSSPAEATIPVNLALPSPFGTLLGDAASGSVLLRTSNESGIDFDGLTIHIENVWIGIAEIESFDIKVIGTAPSLVAGSTSLLLPVVQSKLGIAFQLRDGDFDYGRASLEFTNPAQLPVATDVLLKKILFEVQKGSACGTPTRIGGGVTLAVGPTIGGFALLKVDGTVSYSFPQSSCGLPGVLDVKGEGSFFSIPIVQVETRFTTDWQLTFKVQVGIDIADVARLSAGIEGGLDIDDGLFYAAGHANLDLFGTGVLGLEAIISNVGMAACGQLTPLLAFGFEYRWGESFGTDNVDWPPVCDVDLDAYKPAGLFALRSTVPGVLAAPAAVRADRGRFTLPAGLPFAEVRLDGAGAAPALLITGPNGLRIEHAGEGAAPAQGTGFAVYPSTRTDRTYVRIERPAAGTYVVSDGPGPAIAAVLIADGLPEPDVRGTLRRAGAGYELRYTVRPVPGQLVRFVEDASAVHRVLATTAKPSGTMRFVPAAGPVGKRSVYAIVESAGMPRARILVATFTYRRAALGRPTRVIVTRGAGTLVVTWRPAPGAARYAVSYALRDGRRGTDLVRGRRYTIRNVPGIDAGTVAVAAVGRDSRIGAAVRVNVKPKPKVRKR